MDDSALGAPATDYSDNGDSGAELQDSGQQEGSHNPAWDELLNVLPGGLHKMVMPHLSKWDQGVQQRFQQVQSQYEPYRQFKDNNVSAEDLSQGMQLMHMIATDPRSFYDRMTEHYADEWGLSDQGQDENDEDEYSDEDNPYAQQLAEANDRIQQMQQGQDTIAQYLASQVDEETQANADWEVEQEFDQVKEKYGDLDQQAVNLVVSLALQNDMSVLEAADQVFSFKGPQQQQQSRGVPRVVSTTGGTPTVPPINPSNLNGKDRRSLVASILAQNAATP